VQWLRFLTIFAAVYIFSSFNYTVFQSLATDEYINDIHKSPYYATEQNSYYVEPSYRTKELRMYASLFDVLTLMLSVVFITLLAILRKRVRQRFLIPSMCEQRAGENPACGVLEDVLCMIGCQACAVAQMARHTLALVGDRCDLYSDPGPIEMFPAAHTMSPMVVNSMSQQLQFHQPPQQPFAQQGQSYIPQAVVENGTHPQGRVVEVGQLVQETFPSPATSGGSGVPSANVTTAHSGQTEVPVARHAPADVEQGVSRDAARA